VSESKATIRAIATSKKQKVCVLVDEAQLLRRDVLAELHTLLNFDHDGSNFLSLVLSGQPTLLAHLQYRQAAPLASRVMSKAQIKPRSQMEMEEYLSHHLRVACLSAILINILSQNHRNINIGYLLSIYSAICRTRCQGRA